MRPGAQVGELALPVEGDLRLRRQCLDQLHLVRLVLHQGDRLVTRQRETLQRQILLHDLFHLGLDRRKDLRRHADLGIDIVIEPFVDRRADRQLRGRVQPLDRLRHDVRRGVPKHLLPVMIVEGQDLDRRVRRQRRAQIDDLAVDACGARAAVQSHRQRPAERIYRGVLRHLGNVAVFQCDLQHVHSSFLD